MNPKQVVFQLATQIPKVFLSLKVGEQLVAKKEPCFLSRHLTADAGQVMHLPEGSTEGCLSALIAPDTTKMRSGPLRQKSLVTGSSASTTSFSASARFEHLSAINFLRLFVDGRIAKRQARHFKSFHVLDPCDIELHFPVEAA